MRQVGTLPDEQEAAQFIDYLFTLDIDAQADQAADGWAIWVRDENLLEPAQEKLAEFMKNPRAEQFRAARLADALRVEKRQQAQRVQKQQVQMRQRWNRPVSQRRPITIALIVISIVVTVMSGMSKNRGGAVMRSLLFCDTVQTVEWGERLNSNHLSTSDRLINIKQGQVWRLLTPIFVHYGIMHLVFNMYMLYQLGGLTEEYYGSNCVALIVLFTGVISVVVSSLMPFRLIIPLTGDGGSPFGAGMSGVLFGILGYLWAKMLWDPSNAVPLHPNTILILLVWLGLGVFGVLDLMMGPNVKIGNWAHAVGLLSGMAAGYLSRFSLKGGK